MSINAVLASRSAHIPWLWWFISWFSIQSWFWAWQWQRKQCVLLNTKEWVTIINKKKKINESLSTVRNVTEISIRYPKNNRQLNCFSAALFGLTTKKHHSSALLILCRGLHLWPVNSPPKGPERMPMSWYHHTKVGSRLFLPVHTSISWILILVSPD